MSETETNKSQGVSYADDLYCPDCGYSLRGLTSGRCPECGLVLDFIDCGASAIPWEHRKEIGWYRAYWRTVLMVLFRNKIFCREIYRDVNYVDAQGFRWLSLAHAFVAGFPVLLDLAMHDLYLVSIVGAWLGWSIVGCYLLALIAFTGIPSYFFHPRYLPMRLQNRAVALSYYATAALGFAPLLLALMVLVYLALSACEIGNADLIVRVVGGSLAFGLLGLCWSDWCRMARHALRRASRIWMLRLVPILWLFVCGLCLFGIPLLLYGIALLYFSRLS